MNAVRATVASRVISARRIQSCGNHAVRHAMCGGVRSVPNVSFRSVESVDFPAPPAKSIPHWRGPTMRECGVARVSTWRHRGRNQGASRNGHRKRTRVREACGGAIRPRGVGIHSSHGHFGRSVVGLGSLPLVVLQPARGQQDRRRRLSRGTGLPAAALTPFPVRFVRMSAPADRTAQATRPRSPVVNRATSMPGTPAGTSGGWLRRTRPGPCTRLHVA